MKEFEERWKCGMLSGSPTCFDCGAGSEETARFIWREALNWARKRILENLKITSYDDNIACVKSIQMDIEIELDICQKVEYGDGNGYRKVCTDCPAKMECRDALDKVQNETKTG